MQRLSHWLKQRSAAAAGAVGLVPELLRSIQDAFTAPRVSPARAGGRIHRHSESVAGLFWFLMALLLGTVDFFYAPPIEFALPYLVIVVAASWSGGTRSGLFIAFVSLLGLLAHELRMPEERRVVGGLLFWSMTLHVAIYGTAVFVVSGLRRTTGNLERRVRERTRTLEYEIADRRHTEEQLLKTMQQFRQMAENISDAFWMRDATEARMAYVSPAYEKIWGRGCRELYQFPQRWLAAIHPEDRDRVARVMYTKQAAGAYSQEYRIVRPDGSLRWIRDRAFPIRDSAGKVVRIVGIAEDITERRRLEREILEISDREQARIGQDLHDGLCQKLISIAFDTNALERRLALRTAAETSTAEQIGSVLDDVITEARAVARGLFPVQLETDGLSVALQQLAATVSARGKISCRLDCPRPVSIGDNAIATHLYRIAQEAANNALKHGKAGSIVIQLTVDGDWIELRVSDDGVGIPAPSPSGGGMGLHIMDYRARTIGGSLSIERGADGGTVVSCSVRQQPG